MREPAIEVADGQVHTVAVRTVRRSTMVHGREIDQIRHPNKTGLLTIAVEVCQHILRHAIRTNIAGIVLVDTHRNTEIGKAV